MYQAKDYSHLLGLTGFSDTMLSNHFTLYKGYVDNANAFLDKMNAIRTERADGNEDRKIESAELHRRWGWEYNGMKLHELYFENMTKTPVTLDETLTVGQAIVERFGSIEAFMTHFKTNVGMFRGIGWVALVKRDDGLGVIWIGEHDGGLLANSRILLIMDCWEHASMTDYGIKRADYINAFVPVIDWSVVEERFRASQK